MRPRLAWLALVVACGRPDDGPRRDPEPTTTPTTTETTAPCDRPEDADGDGVADPCDLCPGADDAQDADADGVADLCDPCPQDAPDDSDYDGVCDGRDACPGHDDHTDGDLDGVADGCDVCDGADDAAIPVPTACQGLDEATCGSTTGCLPVYGIPGTPPWTGTQGYAGCMTGDPDTSCADLPGVAAPPCDVSVCWFFGSGDCVPDGWSADPRCPPADPEPTTP